MPYGDPAGNPGLVFLVTVPDFHGTCIVEGSDRASINGWFKKSDAVLGLAIAKICSTSSQMFFFKTECNADFRVTDMGGGIKHEVLDKIWKYGFTTTGRETSEIWSDHTIFENKSSAKRTDGFRGYVFYLELY